MIVVQRAPERSLLLQLVLGFFVYAVAQVVRAFVAGAIFAFEHPETDTVSFAQALHSPTAAALGSIAAAIVSIVGFLAIIRGVARRRVIEFSSLHAGQEFAWGFGIGALVMSLSVTLLMFLGIYEPVGINLSSAMLLGIFTVAVAPAVMEEIFYRGVVLRVLDHWLGSIAALIVTSFAFAVPHSFGPSGLRAGLAVFLTSSLLLSSAYLLTRRMWLAIGVHFGFNLMQGSVFGLNVSGHSQNISLVTAKLHGSSLFTGGAVGGEGSIITIVVCIMSGIVLTMTAVRSGRFLSRAGKRPS